MKFRAFLFGLLLISITSPVFSQSEGWKLSANTSLTLSQTSYSNNWAGGETGAITWISNLNSTAEKQIIPLLINKNTLKLSFGQTHKQQRDSNHWEHPEISTDLIDFESTYRFTVKSLVEPIIALRALSQFVDSSSPGRKKYINPATLTETAGIARAFIKEEKRELITRLGAGARQNINRNLDPRVTHDIGLELVTDFKTPMANERMSYTSKLSIFQSVYYSQADKLKGRPGADDWKSPDLNWENRLTASISKYVMVDLYAQLLYDKQISKGGRFKQTLSLGLTFKLL